VLPDLSRRQFEPENPELMDRPDVDPDTLHRDLANLAAINRFFGGRPIIRKIAALWDREGWPATIFDGACGAGDMTRRLIQAAPSCTLVSAGDLHPVTLAYAQSRTPGVHAWHSLDLRALPFEDGAFDAVICNLVLHHFSEADAVTVLRELKRVARNWVMVSDLDRSRAGYVGAWALGTFWMREPMTRHDALMSVRRAFTPTEMHGLALQAGWTEAQSVPMPFFRQMLILDKRA
jgi:SAM-dependent methyltransferase